MPDMPWLESFFHWLVPIVHHGLEDANPIVFFVYLLTVVIFLLMILLRKSSGDKKPEKTLELLAIIVGSSIGLCAGFFIGSVGPEGARYVTVGGAIWGFISGYALSKFEPLFGVVIDDIKALNAPEKAESKSDLYIKASMFLCCFMLTLIMTLNVRAANAARYAAGQEQKARQTQGAAQKDEAPAPRPEAPTPGN